MAYQTQLVHTVGRDVTLRYGEGVLFGYVYAPDTAARESPKPYFHPVRTLAGHEVTLFRPHDHVWHTGIAMTWAHLSGRGSGDRAEAQNFWGGPTYVRGQGYVQLPNNGRIEHCAWDAVDVRGDTVCLRERLAWVTAGGEAWLAERRRIQVAEIAPEEGCWCLDFTTALANVSGRPLVFGSPTTEGRPLAGYGGLFWRGPRSFLGGAILAGGGLSGPEVMGQAAPWLAYVGRHDGSGADSTLLFLDGPQNPRHPTKWFVRHTPYACASFAFAFDEELALPPDRELALTYRIVIADGAWPRDRAEAYAQRRRATAGAVPTEQVADGDRARQPR